MCAKNHLLIFSSFLDIWENVEWPHFFGPPGMLSRAKNCCPIYIKNPLFCCLGYVLSLVCIYMHSRLK